MVEAQPGYMDEENVGFVKNVILALTPDPVWTERALASIEAGYGDLRLILGWLARENDISNYLEIGVRRGMSMAIVASRRPACHIVGIDPWIDNYGGVPNPGAGFVRQELARVGYRGQANFWTGHSQRIWADVQEGERSTFYDLALVDGDHRPGPAYEDICNVSWVARVIVVDDLNSQKVEAAWRRARGELQGFAFHNWGRVGVMIRHGV